MQKRPLVFWMLIPLLLTACGGGKGTPVEEVPSSQEVEPAPTDTVEILPTEASQSKGEEATPLTEVGTPSECTLVSSLPDSPQEYVELFAITEEDWVLGPDDAAVTLIEYGDFQ